MTQRANDKENHESKLIPEESDLQDADVVHEEAEEGASESPYLRSRRAKDFKGTARRLVRYLRPKAGPLFVVCLFAALSTLFRILTPKVMGKATTKLFEGLLQRMQGSSGSLIDYGYISRCV